MTKAKAPPSWMVPAAEIFPDPDELVLKPGGFNYVDPGGKVPAPASARGRVEASAMTVAELKTIRKGLGLTQGELGRWLLLSGAEPGHSVRMWEIGKRPIAGPVAICLRAFAAGYRPPHV